MDLNFVDNVDNFVHNYTFSHFSTYYTNVLCRFINIFCWFSVHNHNFTRFFLLYSICYHILRALFCTTFSVFPSKLSDNLVDSITNYHPAAWPAKHRQKDWKCIIKFFLYNKVFCNSFWIFLLHLSHCLNELPHRLRYR